MHAQARVVVGSPTRRLTFAVALLLLAALIAAGIAGAFLLRPQPAADDWPGFRGDPSRIGLATTGPIGNPVTRWTFSASGAVSTNVSVAGDLALFSSDDGVLHAVALARWHRAVDLPGARRRCTVRWLSTAGSMRSTAKGSSTPSTWPMAD